MAVCVDASVPLAFLLNDDEWAGAERRWSDWLRRKEDIVSPPLFQPEVTSAIRRRVFLGALPADAGESALNLSLGWPVRLWPGSPTLQLRAYEFAARFNRPRAYDAQYLAVADMLGCELWTADRRLFNAVHHHLPWVHWIGEA